MIAYPDSTEARVGDAVALAHGAYTGTVTNIIESAADLDAWGLDETGLMIDTSYGGAVFHPKHSLTDDEITFVSRAPCRYAENEHNLMPIPDLLAIPGIGRTFVQDFARIGILSIADLIDRDPEQIFRTLCRANEQLDHKTSKNYLYVLRMAVYYANGGRDESKLKWNAWKD